MLADDVRGLIHNRAGEADIREAALASGMRLMREDGDRLVREGITSREEVLRVTRDSAPAPASCRARAFPILRSPFFSIGGALRSSCPGWARAAAVVAAPATCCCWRPACR